MRRRAQTLLLALIAAACRSEPPPAAPPAEVSVEIFAGLAQREPIAEPAKGQVEVLLDITPSKRANAGGVAPWAAARSAAVRFVQGLPETTPLHVHALGLTPGRSCEPSTWLDARRGTRSHAELARQVASLAPAGEGSLAVALAELRGRGDEHGGLEHTRVVVFSDLGPECGGDLCTAASLLLDAGAQLDFVVLGNAETPACFSDLVQGDRWQHAAVITAPAYRVLAYDPNGGPNPRLLAAGIADSSRRAVPSGPVTIELAFERPMRIGPLMLLPGTWTHFRVVEFPSLEPPVREWTWKTLPTVSGARSER